MAGLYIEAVTIDHKYHFVKSDQAISCSMSCMITQVDYQEVYLLCYILLPCSFCDLFLIIFCGIFSNFTLGFYQYFIIPLLKCFSFYLSYC